MTDHARSRGFTLLELLVVLSVVSVVLSLGTAVLSPLLEWSQKKMFIAQLQSDLFHAHSHAIDKKENVIVTFSKEKNQYEAVAVQGDVLFHRKIKPATITEGTLSRFHITPEGNVSNFGKVNFRLNNLKIELTVYIGRGRFSVKG